MLLQVLFPFSFFFLYGLCWSISTITPLSHSITVGWILRNSCAAPSTMSNRDFMPCFDQFCCRSCSTPIRPLLVSRNLALSWLAGWLLATRSFITSVSHFEIPSCTSDVSFAPTKSWSGICFKFSGSTLAPFPETSSTFPTPTGQLAS